MTPTLRERLEVVLAHSAHLGADEQARDAVKCIETWLADRKLRIVPKEATEEMGQAGTDGGSCANDTFVVAEYYYREAWADMIAAAPSNASQLEKAP